MAAFVTDDTCWV